MSSPIRALLLIVPGQFCLRSCNCSMVVQDSLTCVGLCFFSLDHVQKCFRFLMITSVSLIRPQFPEHSLSKLNERLILFRHDYDSPNILQIINAASEVTQDTLVEIVMSGKCCKSLERNGMKKGLLCTYRLFCVPFICHLYYLSFI